MKSLVLYYSFSGNTRRIAKMIQEEIGGDIAEVLTVKPYIGNYNEVVAQGKHEIENDFMPKLQNLPIDIADYDTVILGSPVWWYTFAPAIKTLLSTVNLKNKEVYPFATNGGWIGKTLENFENSAIDANWHTCLDVVFNDDKLITASKEINIWIKNINEKKDNKN